MTMTEMPNIVDVFESDDVCSNDTQSDDGIPSNPSYITLTSGGLAGISSSAQDILAKSPYHRVFPIMKRWVLSRSDVGAEAEIRITCELTSKTFCFRSWTFALYPLRCSCGLGAGLGSV